MNIVSILLLPFSWIYGAVIWLRNRWYDANTSARKRVTVPVISVGNIIAGGTGKTPFVELLLEMLSRKGKKIAVVSRGYRRSSSGTVVVSDGRTLLEPVERAGDEPYQIAEKYPGAVVIVDEQRFRAAQLAAGKFQVDVIVLDDGFQHRSLHRDLDIVMLHDRTPERHRRLLPAGLMREPLSSLRRAHVLVRPADTHVPEPRSSASTVSVRRVPAEMRPVAGGAPKSLADFLGKTCVGFCGIGNPESFRGMLEEAGLHIGEFLRFRDHHAYTVRDLQRIAKIAESRSIELVLTTAKDSVRLKPSLDEVPWLAARCYLLEMKFTVVEGADALEKCVDNVFRKVA